MDIKSLPQLLKGNRYPGRGIVVGESQNGQYAVFAYFIMGRSSNSRNRVFAERDGDIIIYPFDVSKVSDPSLIIYAPVRKSGSSVVVTNGNQTDTICEYLEKGESFEEALDTRCFEPDSPNFTPRISAILNFDGGFSYKMNILRNSSGDGVNCDRFTFAYSPLQGVGHFLHTYNCDGNPIPSFTGEPRAVGIPNGIEEFAENIWSSLDCDNKISLYVRFTDIKTGEYKDKLYNKNI